METIYNYTTLPKKRLAAGVLLVNERGHILIVKPIYRPDWLLPGGAIEERESPGEACLREVKEELGVQIALQRLLCVEYLSEELPQTECVQFVFYGGQLTDRQILAITLPGEELSEYRFVPSEEAIQLLSRKLATRLPYCVQALHEQTTVYLEDGKKTC
jgi:8-oxo-dGTP diphosphatase